jgi:hypothetical protein
MPPAMQHPAAGKQQAPVKPRSFLVGTQSVIEGADYDQTVSTAGAAFSPWALTATGFLKEIVLDFLYTVSSNAVATVATQENFPFNILGNIQLSDINNEAILGPFDSYTLFLINKYGGYGNYDDPATAATTYEVALTSTNAAASSFHFVLRIPLEIVQRDPIGPLASVNNTAALTLSMTVNSSANLYSTPPTTFGSLRIRGTQVFYWEPKTADKQGRPISQKPVASGTTQYWTQGSVPVSSGTVNQQLQTALGYPFRSYLFMLVRNSGTRANGAQDWPDPLIGLKFEANMLVSNYQKSVWQTDMARNYGYPNPNAFGTASVDTRLATIAAVPGTPASAVVPGLENGVFALNWNREFAFGKPGSETRRNYLMTSPASNFIFNGSLGNAGTLYSIVNYVAPPGGAKGDPAALTGGQ